MTRTPWGRSAAIIALALAMPLAATAQTPQATPASGAGTDKNATPNHDQELQFSTLTGAIARQATVNQALSAPNAVISQADIALIPVSRFTMTATDRDALKKAMTPAATAALQSAMTKATVQYVNGAAGTAGGPVTPTLADHVKRLGVDPSNVIAIAMSPKAASGSATGAASLVTIYYRDKGMTQSPTGT